MKQYLFDFLSRSRPCRSVWTVALIAIVMIGILLPSSASANGVIDTAVDFLPAHLQALVETARIGWNIGSSAGAITVAVTTINACIAQPSSCMVTMGFAIVNLTTMFTAWVLSYVAALPLAILGATGSLTQDTFVKIGWRIMRDFANLFFILAWAVMAIGTIVRYEPLSWRTILPKLLFAAILVNFSLVIAGVVIDVAHIFTNFFINSIGQTPKQLADALPSVLNAQESFIPKENTDSSILGGFDTTISGGGVAFILLFQAIIGLVLLALGTFAILLMSVLLIVRVAALWLLLILVPLAFVARIFPQTQNYWGQWWQKFFKWTFLAPIFAFVLFLSVKAFSAASLASVIDAMNVVDQEILDNGIAPQLKTLFIVTPATLVKQLLAIAILYGGMKVALSGAEVGGKEVYGWMSKGAGAVGNQLKDVGRRGAERSGLAEATRQIRTALPPFLSGTRPADAEEQRRAILKGGTKPQSKAIAVDEIKQGAIGQKAFNQRIEAVNTAAEKGWLDSDLRGNAMDVVKAFKNGYPQLWEGSDLKHNLAKARPDWLTDIGEDPGKAVEKLATKGDLGNVHADFFKGPANLELFANNARPESLGQLKLSQLDAVTEGMESASDAQRIAIQEQLARLMSNKDIESLVRRHPASGMFASGATPEQVAAFLEGRLTGPVGDPTTNLVDASGTPIANADRLALATAQSLPSGAFRHLTEDIESFSQSLDHALSRFDRAFDTASGSLLDSATFSAGKLEQIFKSLDATAKQFATELEDSTKLAHFMRTNANNKTLHEMLSTLNKSNKEALAVIQKTVNAAGPDRATQLANIESAWGSDARRYLEAQKIITLHR